MQDPATLRGIEVGLLGAALHDKAALGAVCSKLAETDFTSYGSIFAVVRDLYTSGAPVTPLSLASTLGVTVETLELQLPPHGIAAEDAT